MDELNKDTRRETIQIQEEGIRLDKYLSEQFTSYSRENIKSWIKEGKITIDDRPVKASEKTIEGQVVVIEIPEQKSSELKAQEMPLDIVYEDDAILVVNKEQGMVVHPGAGNPDYTLVNALLHHTNGNLSSYASQTRPGIIHRLDKDTSGLLVVAKTDQAHRKLVEDLQERKITRIYDTVVHGFFKEKQGMIDAAIARDSKDRVKMAVDAEGKYARTYFRVLESLKHGTYLRVKLDSGRTHQIRVHMKFIGHPVMGDALYGNKRQSFGLEGQCLHARYLSFAHPLTAEVMHFEAALPEWFQKLLNDLGYDKEKELQWQEDWPKGASEHADIEEVQTDNFS